MIHKKLGKGTALLCAIVMLGVTACKAEPVEENRPGVTGGNVVSQGENIEISSDVVIQVPEIGEAIETVMKNQATEEAERTAVVKLSDSGIEITGSGCEADGNRLKIKEAGVYEISGRLSDGSIFVNPGNESEVQLILNGVTIHNETGAALFCKKAAKVTVTLAEGSVNVLSGGATYVFEEGEDEPDAVLFAKDDLVINGSGRLEVTAAYKDAIKGKDSLYILGGDVIVNAAEDGIAGKDLLYIADGTFVIKTGGGSANAAVKNDSFGFGEGKGKGKWQDWNFGTETEEEETISSKGLKSDTLVCVTGGRFELDTMEDGVHSNVNITISGGEFNITSGDDGIHADEKLLIEGESRVKVAKSYEGLEALEIVINGGVIDITASDDGINAAGGADGSGIGHPGMGMFGEGEGEVTVNGGTVVVNAEGDGLDSNGNLTINGGKVTVFGPTGGGNGVLDYGGLFAMNGGTLFAAGTSDMSQTPSETSKQYALAVVLENRGAAGSTVAVAVDGETVVSATVPKSFNYIVASAKEFVAGAEVTLSVEEKECYSGTLTETVTCFGFSGGKGGFGGMGGFGNKNDGGMRPDFPNGNIPEFPDGEWPGFPNGEMPEFPEGERPQRPEDGGAQRPGGMKPRGEQS